MKLPILASNRPTELSKADFQTQMTNAASAVAAGAQSGGIPLLIYQSRGNIWTYNRGPLTPEDAGLLIIDFTQISKGLVEWVGKKPRQAFFSSILSGKEVTEDDLPKPTDRHAYRAQSDGVATTYQLVGAFLDSGDPFRFESSSRGGTNAVEELVRSARAASLAQGEVMHPVVELDSDSYPHPEYGQTFVPVFRVIGFVPKSVADKGPVSEANIVTETDPPTAVKGPAPKAGPVGNGNGKRGGASAL